VARQLRIEFSGALYLVTSTGNAGNSIYRDNEDRQLFLDTLSEVILKYRWTCHAYCLMANHYHLCVETPKANLSRGMRHLNGVYTQRFNSRHRQFGHIFHGRFKALIVEKERYFLDVCRHIVTNPVRVGLTGAPEEWRWSSYRGTACLDIPPYFLTTAEILRRLNGNGEARTRYREYVATVDGALNLPELVKGQLYLGSEDFIWHIQELLSGQLLDSEIPRQQLQSTRLPLPKLIPADGGPEREQGIHDAHVLYSYTLKEIGAYLGIHYSSVSRRVKKVGMTMGSSSR
jgi:REP element-mobilizing transposase RayT